MKAKILNMQGKEKETIELPKCFSEKIREDIVVKVLETKRNWQPYGPSLVGGKQHSAKGKIVHRRHVWRSGYGRGWSRVPRKIFSQKGSQFNMEAAEVPQAKGGMRAHPPKAFSMFNKKKINKKEMKIAFNSALSATASNKKIIEKYERLKNMKIENLPLILESKFISLKTKEALQSLKKVLGELFEVAIKQKSIRSGIGKLRGRKYKKSGGMLFVIGKKEKFKTSKFDVINVNNLSVLDLAKGGLGRLTVYTEEAINELGRRK